MSEIDCILDDSHDSNDNILETLTKGSDKAQDFSTKLRENQQIGYQLAEEIRKLRDQLNTERRKNRLLKVTNENLVEQLSAAEQRMNLLETQELKAVKELSSLQKKMKKQKGQYEAILAKYRELQQSEIKLKQYLKETASKNQLVQIQSEESFQQLQYWKNCFLTYEEKIKELLTEKEIKRDFCEEQRKTIFQLEHKLSIISSKVLRFTEEAFDLLDLKKDQKDYYNSFDTVQSNSSLHNSTLSKEEQDSRVLFQRLDQILAFTKKRFQLQNENLRKYKTYTQKLLSVIKMYEEIVPEEDE